MTYNHMVHVRYSIFDPGCCECTGCGEQCAEHPVETGDTE